MLKSLKKLAVFGATGSVGDSVLDVVRQAPERFRIDVLTGNKNVDKLARLINEFRPKYAVLCDAKGQSDLLERMEHSETNIMFGEGALVEVAKYEVDLHVAAIVGIAGLRPTYAAVESGINVALANKEALVCAGEFIMDKARNTGAEILPLDSEHNAIFQVLEPENQNQIERLILTASGGPFRTRSRDDLVDITPAQALKHPNWSMGAKISIDSATLANKALELAEACILFDMPQEKVDIVIHPQSTIHSMVEYKDGSILAQMGAADMRVPVASCLAWPERIAAKNDRLNLSDALSLDLYPIDIERFLMVGYMRACLSAGAEYRVAFNAANEVAVENFLSGDIAFLDIERIVGKALENVLFAAPKSIEDVIAIDLETRQSLGDITWTSKAA